MVYSNFESLPVELLHKILSYNVVSYKDLCSVGSSSSLLRNIISSNSLWKIKFLQTFNRLNGQNIFNSKGHIDWKYEIVQRINIGHEVRARLDTMGVTCRNISELSYGQFTPLIQVAKRHQRGLDYIVDELMLIVNQKNRHCHLMRKYYGLKLLRYLQQYRLCKVWDEIVNLPENKQILEDGAFFIGQWQYPEIDVIRGEIRKSLDDLAKEVLVLLKEHTGGKHPVLRTDSDTLSEWRDTILPDNQWTPEQCKQIIVATSKLIFERMGFKVQRCIYQNLPINKELDVRNCDPLTVSIIYEGILRRLGVKCHLISSSCHFLLFWSDSYANDGHKQSKSSFFIDVRDEGAIIKRNCCPAIFELSWPEISPSHVVYLDTSVKMVQCMANKIFYNCTQNGNSCFSRVSRIRSALEMLLITEPTEFNNYIQIMKFYDDNGIEIDHELSDRLSNFIPKLTPDQQKIVSCYLTSRRIYIRKPEDFLNDESNVHPKRRLPNRDIKYAIGLVMQHKQYGYRCVILGWDHVCIAPRDWIQTMRVDRLEFKQYQPFYNVLVEDGSFRYAAQENLHLVHEEFEIDLPEVGRYFIRWCGRYYEPAPIRAAEYPDDKSFREALLKGCIM